MRHRLKKTGHWLFENGFPALFWSGLTVGLGLLFFENYFEENSCERTGHYSDDAAKKLFWAIFVTRLFVLPLMVKAIKKYFPESLPSHETIVRLEVEFNDAIETGLFVFETGRLFSLSFWASLVIAIPAAWPIFCSIYKSFDPNFVRGPKYVYSTYSFFIRHLFSFSESLYKTLSLASATSFLASFLINVFYNSTHPDDLKNENTILSVLITIACFAGAISILDKRTYKATGYSEAFINTLYYSFNITTFSVVCLHEAAFTDSAFVKSGWIYVTFFGLACLGLAVIGGFHGVENPYISEEHHEKEKTPRQKFLERIDRKDWRRRRSAQSSSSFFDLFHSRKRTEPEVYPAWAIMNPYGNEDVSAVFKT